MDTHTIINVLHILIIVPFFLYIGITKTDLPEKLFTVLMGIGGVITLYHAYKLVVRMQQKSGFAWVNAVHVLFVGPLLFYIGYRGKDTPRSAFEILLLFAFAAGGYHLYELAAYSSMKNGANGGAVIIDMKGTST
jgi:hypothetical protein